MSDFLEKLNDILKKELVGLSEDDIKFLKARRSYIPEGLIGKYKELLQEVEKPPLPKRGRPKKVNS